MNIQLSIGIASNPRTWPILDKAFDRANDLANRERDGAVRRVTSDE